METFAARPIPAHVPPDMVGDFSLFSSPGMQPTPNGDPQAAAAVVHQGPRIFYSPVNTRDGRGTWVITRAQDQRKVLQDPETFSSHRSIFASALGESWPMIPLELDPPDHGKFRSLLNPLLSPKRVMALESAVRERAIFLIDRIAAAGTSCHVMEDFAFPFAVNIFLRFLGLSDDRLDEFVRWANALLHGDNVQRPAAARTIIGFIDELSAERRRRPVDDFMSFLVQSKIDDRPLTDMEIRGTGVLLFIAGLDTVAAAIGFDLNYLARHMDDQQLLRSDPSRIVLAAEELLRAYPTVQMIRVATRDIDFEGAPIRRGDYVSCATMIANRDPLEFPHPERIDLAREDNRHTAFAYGPHRCLGSHLARREIVVGLEEWLKRIPPFRIKQGTAPVTFGGHVFGIENLVLDWS
ncbi:MULTISPECIES: cytochrome P450 [Sphingobium]|uniref:Cytochrome P450 n=1 Tax=Sphingobium fuliginis (strain ATCC 27551) TaxID=336203 RepID=A0ABQ1EV00_SPHSA|nr:MULTISPECIES: cytochrome P450 [Sphingobium]AJR25614.1 cytochrome P450 [Sphingobium sp. YBL2]RYL98915.1 cytochrome P450 [Sphingobium fuliginis]UXC92253.1 cytochrome P450 [Sphingobium sp. RSMS]WDA37726.1 cytochrome P450 [Sphingobium sp. YC-XJ3]GFZ87906.1 cytochrome P450 [Sphingobium fuliginis]